MIPGENILPTNTRFEPFKLFQNGTKSNVSTKTNIASNVHMDELLKTQILRKKEKYAIDCPLCKAKVLPFRIDFNSVIFLCVNQEVN